MSIEKLTNQLKEKYNSIGQDLDTHLPGLYSYRYSFKSSNTTHDATR